MTVFTATVGLDRWIAYGDAVLSLSFQYFLCLAWLLTEVIILTNSILRAHLHRQTT